MRKHTTSLRLFSETTKSGWNNMLPNLAADEILADSLTPAGLMTFASKAWSSETLLRGLDQVETGSKTAMVAMLDPDQEAMEKELERLQASGQSLKNR